MPIRTQREWEWGMRIAGAAMARSAGAIDSGAAGRRGVFDSAEGWLGAFTGFAIRSTCSVSSF